MFMPPAKVCCEHEEMEVVTTICVIIKPTNVVATLLWGKCEDETHTFEIGIWKSFGSSKISEFDCKGQNTSH